MPVQSTNQAPRDPGWAITDPVIALVGTDRFELRTDAVIGSADDCGIQLHDPANRVSRHHASVTKTGDAWVVRDLDSTNGVRADGELRQTFELAPAVEIELGSVTLVAESARLATLRELLACAIGFSRRAAVAAGIQAIRRATIQRMPLLVCGAGDLTGLARRIHELVVADGPFVVCEGEAALPHLDGSGTLCLVGKRPARDLPSLAAALREPGKRPRITSCAPSTIDVPDVISMFAKAQMIEVPPITARIDEVTAMLDVFARLAADDLGAAGTGFREHEHNWLDELAYTTLAELDETARRVVAMRNWGVSGGAAKLGITHGALSTWASRRKVPT
ncbi:MAG: FHA domain-containing protein [Kofleriaceae bacterium]